MTILFQTENLCLWSHLAALASWIFHPDSGSPRDVPEVQSLSKAYRLWT